MSDTSSFSTSIASTVARDSPLFSVAANFFLEDFMERILDSASRKPYSWFWYIDTFMRWPHGLERLRDFLDYLNSIHKKSPFTTEIVTDGHIPFLYINIY
jgi:hypothetical protein